MSAWIGSSLMQGANSDMPIEVSPIREPAQENNLFKIEVVKLTTSKRNFQRDVYGQWRNNNRANFDFDYYYAPQYYREKGFFSGSDSCRDDGVFENQAPINHQYDPVYYGLDQYKRESEERENQNSFTINHETNLRISSKQRIKLAFSFNDSENSHKKGKFLHFRRVLKLFQFT